MILHIELEIEQLVIDRLLPLKRQNILIEKFPASPAELRKPFSRERIIVGYQGEARSSEPSAISGGPIAQQRSLNFEIVYQLKDLRDHTASHSALSQVDELLTGWQPIDASDQFQFVRGGFVDWTRETTIWLYSQTYTLPIREVIQPRRSRHMYSPS